MRITLETSVGELAKRLPDAMAEDLRRSDYYVQKTDTITVSSQEHVKQKENTQSCFRKVNHFLGEVAKEVVSNEAVEGGIPEFSEKALYVPLDQSTISKERRLAKVWFL